MKRSLISMGLAGLLAMAAAPSALADGISDIEGARANERADRALTAQEAEKLNRYGGNDDGYRSYRGYHDGGYDDDAHGSPYIGPPRNGYVGRGYDGHDDADYDDYEYDD